MDSVCSEYKSEMEEEFLAINDIKEEEFISLTENVSLPKWIPEKQNDCQEELVELKHSPVKDWSHLCWTCHYCDKSFNDFVNLKAHQESSHQICDRNHTYFECFDCKELVLGYSSFLNHIRRSHYEVLKLCCDVCNEVLPDYRQLSIHRDKHIDTENEVHPAVFHCILCEKVHSTEELLKYHLQDSHSFKTADKDNQETTNDEEEDESVSMESTKCKDEYGETEQIFQCGRCVKNFTNALDLKKLSFITKEHMVTHTDERPFKCDTCSKKYRRKNDLKKHMIAHTNERPFQCDICLKEFNRKNVLKRHKITHTNERPFKCNICSKEFNFSCNLERHMITHTSERPFQCDICSKEFRNHSNLERHMITHTNERPFQCDICSKGFAQKTNLKFHMETHTPEPLFKCETCSKEYRRKRDLKSHMTSHTNERPFQCDICSQEFTQKSNLKYHMGIHTHERLFKCETCSKEFRRKRDLKRHMMIHNDERCFKCDICSRGFIQKSNLKVHMKVHINKRVKLV